MSTFVLFGGASTVFVVLRKRSRWLDVVRTLAPTVPSVVCAIAWWHAGALARIPGQAERVLRISASTALDAAPVWAFDIWRSHEDELLAGAWWIAYGALVVDGLRRRLDVAGVKRGAWALVPLACTVVLYSLTPFHVGPAGYLDVRLAPLLALFSIPLLRPAAERVMRVAVGVAAVVSFGTAASATFEMRRLERDVLGDLPSILGTLRPGARLAMLNFEGRSEHAYFWPYVFAGSYHRLKPGTVAAYSFTELPHWPVHYAPGHAPPERRPFWTYHPCELRYRADGTYYDYVLAQGRYDPFAAPHPGPELHAIAHAGRFTLYERDAQPEADPDAPDRSVCRRRPRSEAPDDDPP